MIHYDGHVAAMEAREDEMAKHTARYQLALADYLIYARGNIDHVFSWAEDHDNGMSSAMLDLYRIITHAHNKGDTDDRLAAVDHAAAVFSRMAWRYAEHNAEQDVGDSTAETPRDEYDPDRDMRFYR